jgi:hypothetical protein
LIAVLAVGVVFLLTQGSSAGPRLLDGAAARSSASRPVTPPRPGSGSSAKYGGIPSWLPKAKVPVGRILAASRSDPVLAVQGDTVSIRLARVRVLVTAVGPVVPEEGRFPVPATSPCTFTVTFARASAAIPHTAASFTILDDLGQIDYPRVTALDGGAPPRRVSPGQTLSLSVHDVLPTGGGRLRWAPGGPRPLVSWDFDVEID